MKKFVLVMSLLVIAPLTSCNGGSTPPNDYNPLCLTCNSASGGSIFFYHAEQGDTDNFNVQYSYNKKDWTDIDTSVYIYPIVVNSDESIYFRGNNPTGFNTIHDISTIVTGRFSCISVVDGDFTLSGNVMSLIQPTDFENITELPCEYCFAGLFGSVSKTSNEKTASSFGGIIDAKDLILPATKLTNSCYYEMFYGNNNMISAPQLPATELADDCYGYMFYKCTSLQQAPDLLATTSQLKPKCYEYMFYCCDELEKIKVGFDDNAFNKEAEPPYPYTNSWLYNINSSTNKARQFIWKGKTSGVTWEYGESTVPTNWELSNW